jgi:hypothetical protein
MDQMETNIYAITNLKELSCKYKMYQVRGLSPDSEDYHKNLQLLVKTLSDKTQSPCISLKENETTFIAQPVGYQDLPDLLDLVRVTVKIEKMPTLRELNFDSLNQNTSKLALRFLQFALQQPLHNNISLWQPGSGHPFFNKTPDQDFRRLSDDVDLFRGFSFRLVLLPNERIGVCVDTSSKYVSRNPLPTDIGRNDNRKYKGLNSLYEYGNTWYEIKIEGLNDLNASEVKLPDGSSLFEDVHRRAGSRKSRNLLSLPRDCSVLFYRNSRGEQRNVPSGLCRPTYTTDHPNVRRFHTETIKSPNVRRREIQFVVDTYLKNLMFHSNRIVLSDKPIVVDPHRIQVPDLEFGNGKVLSLRGTPGFIHTSLKDFGNKKKELLYSNEAGLFVKKPFDRQYLILPRSVLEAFGKKFIEDVKSEVNQLFSSEERISYSPIVIPYDDSAQKSLHRIGTAVIKAVQDSNAKPGYGLIMIPEISSKRIREDELSNLIMREMRERDIYVSIIHTSVPMDSYEYAKIDGENEGWKLVEDHKRRKVFKGYLKNVVLNKILFLNSYWPFVLKTPLNADLTIGIDVKNKVAGFTLIHKTGANIRFFPSESDQKEQLSKNHIRSKIAEILRKEEETLASMNIKNIVIHRQGRLFEPEKEGILEALNSLAKEKLLPEDYQCTFLDIRSTSRVPFRFFNITSTPGGQEELVRNPMIGICYAPSDNEAFICTTGFPFGHKGTTRPLHVVKTDGNMPLKLVLEDIFYLSNLTWTKVDDCSRYPLSIKMGDIRLREWAGQYDRDALEFGENKTEGGDEDE